MDFSLNVSPGVMVTLVGAFILLVLVRFGVRSYIDWRETERYEAAMLLDESLDDRSDLIESICDLRDEMHEIVRLMRENDDDTVEVGLGERHEPSF